MGVKLYVAPPPILSFKSIVLYSFSFVTICNQHFQNLTSLFPRYKHLKMKNQHPPPTQVEEIVKKKFQHLILNLQLFITKFLECLCEKMENTNSRYTTTNILMFIIIHIIN